MRWLEFMNNNKKRNTSFLLSMHSYAKIYFAFNKLSSGLDLNFKLLSLCMEMSFEISSFVIYFEGIFNFN